MLFQDTLALTIDLVSRPSVTDTRGESDFAPWLASRIAGIPYFRDHPEDLVLERTGQDTKERSVLYAFVRGSGSRCVILTGHYDVVATGCYGDLEPLAFSPEALGVALAGRRDPEDPGSVRACEDLESGAFLAGRGALDMKSGLAIGLAVLERFSHAPGAEGNILFLAVPDEEGASHGMRHAAPRIAKFLAERGCTATAAINLDCAVDQGEGEAGRLVFLGSVGKLLPFVHFVGRPSHAGAPFDGVNPAILAAAFALRAESGTESLGEMVEAPPPPPTILYLREMRETYDVTTPRSVFCALNVLSHWRSPEEVLESVSKLALEAMNEAVDRLRARAALHAQRTGFVFDITCPAPEVLDLHELSIRSPGERESAWFGTKRSVVSGHDAGGKGAAATEGMQDRTEQGAGTGGDPVLECARIVDERARLSGIEGPVAIVGFAPPYYPVASVDHQRDAKFLAMLRETARAVESESGLSIRMASFFPGISDMSYLAPADGPDQARYVSDRCPLFIEDTGEGLGCPVVNIGPWGREYHQTRERVEKRYAFEVLPEFIWKICVATLGS